MSFTIKNIDAREKLKREIEPLLARNRNKAGAGQGDAKADRVDSRVNSEERRGDLGFTGGPDM